jgi:hypothetical protein
MTAANPACRSASCSTMSSGNRPRAANCPARARRWSRWIFGACGSSSLGLETTRRVRGPGLHCLDA